MAASDQSSQPGGISSSPGANPRLVRLPLGLTWSSLIIGLIVGIVGSVGVALAIVAPLIVAHRQDLPFERLYGSAAVSLAARVNAGNAQNPEAGNQRALRTGRDAYVGSCSGCHGANGNGKGVFGQATYPPATDLTTGDAKEKSDAELFWMVKNGLSFTGMPGFGEQYDDTTIWSIVTYLRALQQNQTQTIAVPTPNAAQFAAADITGNTEQRGAAVYFAQGCQSCHGAVGDAPDGLGLRGGGGEATEAVRNGRQGMPAYGPDQISDSQLADLIAYMNTFPNRGRGGGDEGGNEGGRG